MGILLRKPKMSIEDFCQQFYDSQILNVKSVDEGKASTLWEVSLNFVADADSSLAKVDRDLFRREMTALHMELFGVLWQRCLWQQATGEGRSDVEVLKYIPREVVFTKSYLQQKDRLDIWETMFAYNKAIANYRWYSDVERAIDRECINRYIIKEKVDSDCTGRIENRMCYHFLTDDLPGHLTGTVARRLGWDIKPDSEAFLQLEAFILHLYSHAKACVDSVVIATQRGTVKSKVGDSAKTVGVGVTWFLGVCLFFYLLAGNPLHELALIQYGETVPGSIVDAWEEPPEDGGSSTDGVEYTYSVDGVEFTETTVGRGLRGLGLLAQELDLPYPIEVEYLPDNPTVSRIKGTGHASIRSWLLYKVGLGGLLLAAFGGPGIYFVYKGVRDTRRFRRIQKAIVF